MATTTLAATDVLLVTDAEELGPQDVKEKIPRPLPTMGNLKSQQRTCRQLHTIGTLSEGGPSLPGLPSKSAG